MANIIKSQYPDPDIPPDTMTFPDFLLKEFAKYGYKVAMISPQFKKSYTFNDLIDIGHRMAAGLHEKLGLRKGDVISTCLGNYIELIPFMLGCNLLGAIVNTANPAYTIRELVHQFSDCGTRFVLTTSDMVDKINAVKLQCKSITDIITLDRKVHGCFYLPDLIANDSKRVSYPHINAVKDLAYLLYSSGTTGLPKAVMLTHRTLVVNLCQSSRNFLKSPAPTMYSPTSDDISISAFPMFHIGGIIISTIWALVNGGTMVMFDRFCPDQYLKAIREYKITRIVVPPLVLVHWTKSLDATPGDFASVKHVICGGACVGKALSEAVAAKMKPDYIIQIYGMTELSPLCVSTPLLPLSWQKLGSAGRLLANTLGKVIDINTGEALGPMKSGEICIKGPQLMAGYLNNPTATKQTIDSDGWLHTGDIGHYDEDEYFYIMDRIKDVMKVKGFQVPPAELEGLLFSHPAIAEAVIIGVPDEYAGELPGAYVVKKPGAHVTEEEVKKFIAERVVSYKRLEGGVRFIDELPKTPSGKLLRRILREQAKKEMKSKL